METEIRPHKEKNGDISRKYDKKIKNIKPGRKKNYIIDWLTNMNLDKLQRKIIGKDRTCIKSRNSDTR